MKKRIGFGPDDMTFTEIPKTILRAALKVGDAYPKHNVQAFREGFNWHIFGGKHSNLRYVVRAADGALLGVERFITDSFPDGDWEFVDVDETWRVA